MVVVVYISIQWGGLERSCFNMPGRCSNTAFATRPLVSVPIFSVHNGRLPCVGLEQNENIICFEWYAGE